MGRRVHCLKASDHFSCVHRIATLIEISGYDQSRRIGDTLSNLVIRGICKQVLEVVFIVRVAVFIYDVVRVIKKMIAQHIQERRYA